MSERTSRVLVVGSGGREHALVWALRHSEPRPHLLAYPGNPGIFELAEPLAVAGGSVESVARAAAEAGVTLAVIGPDAFLAAGTVDELRRAGVPAFGPTRQAARIETSKSWAKGVMDRAGVPTARHQLVRSQSELREHLAAFSGRVAVKADGLAAGKGVLVTDDPSEAEQFAGQYLRDGQPVLLEEALEGPEVSLFAFVRGPEVLPLACAQDHKRAYDGDRGPNTGGMGAISPPPLPAGFLEDATERIVGPVAAEMVRMATPFRGVLYAGLMLTASGPYVLEFNARFGDPETQVILPRLDFDLLEVLGAVATDAPLPDRLELNDLCACGVTIASTGYPVSAAPQRPVTLPDRPKGTLLFHAGTARGQARELEARGGRVFTAVGVAESCEVARERAYELARGVEFEGAWYRSDIGAQR